MKKNHHKIHKVLVKFLLKECEKIFGLSNIPNPIWTKSFYWKNGVDAANKELAMIDPNNVLKVRYEDLIFNSRTDIFLIHV